MLPSTPSSALLTAAVAAALAPATSLDITPPGRRYRAVPSASGSQASRAHADAPGKARRKAKRKAQKLARRCHRG